MSQSKQSKWPKKAWLRALSSLFGEPVTHATRSKRKLHGGTVAEVFLVYGTAITNSRGEQPYKLVWKVTRKWSRPGDPLSWRREYDWIHENSNVNLGSKLRIPTCYHMELNEVENHLWMEYVDGVSGNALSQSMLDEVAFQWGAFQRRSVCESKPLEACNLSNVSFLESELTRWYHNPYLYQSLYSDTCPIPQTIKDVLRRHDWDDGYSIVYHYVRSDECDLPKHLKAMIIDLDHSKDAVFLRFSRLPIVISHRDVWEENLIYKDGLIYLIDWDCVGWGYLGEDLASLIADDTPTGQLDARFASLYDQYLAGYYRYRAESVLEPKDIVMMILIKYGYRLIDNYWFARAKTKKNEIVKRLSVFHDWLHRPSSTSLR